jgi:hypothetical protein
MPSQLIGIDKTLTWGEFRGPVPANTPFAAQTNVTFTVSPPTFQQVGGGFQLADAVTVRIVFDAARSWRIPTMNQWPAQLQQELLEHEQGHYDITALMARDCFIEIMKLKGTDFTNQGVGTTTYRGVESKFRSFEDLIQKEYDNQTGHSQANVFVPSTNMFTPPHQKSSTQIKWEKLILKGFTDLRSPAESSPPPHNNPYKKELVTALKEGSIQIQGIPALRP